MARPLADPPPRSLDGERPGRRATAWTFLFVLALVGFTGRDTYGAVPPLFPDIAAALGLSGLALGVLTALPTLCMGLLAPAAQWLAARLTAEHALGVTLAVMALAKAARLGAGNPAVLFLSTAIVGATMGATSALMPALIRSHAPSAHGLATGIFALSVAAGTGLGAYWALPLEHLLGGWKLSMASWSLLTVLVAAGWFALVPLLRTRVTARDAVVPIADAGRQPAALGSAARGLPWRSATARWVTAYVCVQSIVAFSIVAWLVPAFREAGWSADRAASMMIVFQVAQGLAMLTLPSLSDRLRSKRPLMAVSAVCALAGVVCLGLHPVATAYPATVLLGVGLGGGFSLGLVLIVDCTRSQTDAARLAALVFLLAYVVAAFGPLAVGLLHDVTGGFAAGFLVIAGVQAIQFVGLVPLRPGRTIADERRRP